jgi:hypothetical protein
MSATVRIGPSTATITNGVWTSTDEALPALLQKYSDQWEPAEYVPNLDLAKPEEIARLWGGEVTAFTRGRHVRGRLY